MTMISMRDAFTKGGLKLNLDLCYDIMFWITTTEMVLEAEEQRHLSPPKDTSNWACIWKPIMSWNRSIHSLVRLPEVLAVKSRIVFANATLGADANCG